MNKSFKEKHGYFFLEIRLIDKYVDRQITKNSNKWMDKKT